MRAPRHLEIAHATFSIRPDRAACDADDADGLFVASARRIAYRPGMAADRRREVLLHEALHACVEVSRGHGLDYDAEEAVVDALTGPLLDLIRRNPDFLEFLRA